MTLARVSFSDWISLVGPGSGWSATQLEAMEVGLEPWMLSTGRDREGDPEARLQVVVVDGETSMSQASGVVDVEISADEAAAAAASEPRRNATERTALAVAATAAVELTNLFFLLRGGGTVRRRCGRIEGISTLFAFAAFLSAAGLLIVRNAARRRLVVLVASAAALFVAAAGTVLSLLRVQGSR
ncbi:unnamed protein product [Urochloa decumbens]|uniref:Uncharacterized protein n=1 Tax=Urochloa decumbens TaxID=240449 RepID=A0ABC9EMF8_9POAL